AEAPRLDPGADHDAQPDAIFPATNPDLRLVRRYDAQYCGEPRQNGRRHASGDRHRSADRGCCHRAETHGKPTSLRQNRRWLLMHRLLLRTRTRIRDATKPLGEAAVGALTVGMLRTTRYFDPIKTANLFGRIARLIGPVMREQRIGRANLTAAFPEKSPEEIEAILAGVWDNLGRIGAEFAHLDHIWDYDADHPEKESRIEFGARTKQLFDQLRDDGKPALIFTSHLGSWELPALGAVAHGLDCAILYRRPNIESADHAIGRIRAVNM